jgi:hypothetical protein
LGQILPQQLQASPQDRFDQRVMNLRERVLRNSGSVRALKSPVLVTAIGGTPVGEIRQLSPDPLNLA